MSYIEYQVKVHANGFKYWYLNGNLHREDGPALEYTNGFKYWYLNGQLHREDGPAVEYANGSKLWYLNGTSFLTENLYLEELARRKQALAPASTCEGKVVVIDGKEYRLTSV